MDKKVVIVTGASRGIGREIALKFAEEGYYVVINYNNSEDAAKEVLCRVEELGSKGMIFRASVNDFDALKKMVDAVVEKCGRIDCLVNNAGILRPQFVMMTKEKDWQESIETNMTGNFYISKLVMKEMVSRRSGKVVNISSVAAIRGIKGQAVYAATKSAINALTRVLAKEMATYGINVNAIAPGFIETDMTKIFENRRKEYLETIPMRKFGECRDVANLAYFLASEESKYITGQVICLDGGFSI